MNNELLVIYRACDSEADGQIKPERPAWFSKSKCLQSFYKEFNGKCKIVVFFDTKREDESEFFKLIKNTGWEIFKFNGLGNQASLIKVYDFYDSVKTDYPNVYFVEDDYLHIPGSYSVLVEGVNKYGLVSLYDHPDRYNLHNTDVSFGKESIFIDRKHQCYWRTAESTTQTFACKREIFEYYKSAFYDFCNRGDGAPQDREFFRYLYVCGIRLHTPMPSWSTHCVERYLADFIDWKTFDVTLEPKKD